MNMTPDEFAELRATAIHLHATQPAREKAKVTLDAVFIAIARSRDGAPPRLKRVSDEAPPEWFCATLEKLRGSGERITVGRFLLLAGRYPATRADSLGVGRWLREAGFIPKKTGGQVLFDL